MRMSWGEANPRCVSGGFRGATQAVCPDEQVAEAFAARWNAVLDALAELDRDSSMTLSPEVARAGQILRNALNA